MSVKKRNIQSVTELQGEILVGSDEAGRGALAGPVVAAAVAFPAGFDLSGRSDSKALNE